MDKRTKNNEITLAILWKTVRERWLFLILALSESLSGPLITGTQATGKIRDYQILVGGLIMLNFPVSYIFLKAGAAPEVTVVVAIVISQICLFARLYMLRRLTEFPVGEYLIRVYLNVLIVTLTAVILPLALMRYMPGGLTGFLLDVPLCIVCAALAVLFKGCSSAERKELWNMIRRRVHI